MTYDNSDGSAGRKQTKQCDLSSSHAISTSLFDNNSRHADGSGTDQLIQNAILGKNGDKAVLRNDLLKLKQEARTVRNRKLSKEEIDSHLLMVLAFHDLPRKKMISWLVC